jgi:hypothetical protein
MRIHEKTLNGLVDDLTLRLAGGTLALYPGGPPASPQDDLPVFKDALVVVTLRTPAFHPAVGGRAMGLPLETAGIRATGEASWGRLSTSSGEAIADLVVSAADSPDVREADIVVDRTDFHRGGICAVSSMLLRLPG